MRTALNRAYRTRESRSVILLRFQSIGLVVFGAIILIAYTFLIVLAPLLINAITRAFPAIAEIIGSLDVARYTVAGLLLIIGLFLVHILLPAGHRRVLEIVPGIIATMLMWMVAGIVFGTYLANFANYVSTYGGLGGIMSALVFLYICSMAFILGGEFNAALIRQRKVSEAIARR